MCLVPEGARAPDTTQTTTLIVTVRGGNLTTFPHLREGYLHTGNTNPLESPVDPISYCMQDTAS